MLSVSIVLSFPFTRMSRATLPSKKMSAALFGSITMAVTRAAVAAPVAAVAAAASPPRRSMSGDGKTQVLKARFYGVNLL